MGQAERSRRSSGPRTAGWTARSIAVWGLVYKQGTDTLRRSGSVELCRELARAGARMKAHDAAVRAVPDDLVGIFTLCPTPLDAAEDASAIIVETDWPSYRDGRRRTARGRDADDRTSSMRTGFCPSTLGEVADVRYVRVGGRAR